MTATLAHCLFAAQDPLPVRQQVTAVLLAVGVLVTVVELVRRRKLREEYSWVWVGTAIALIALALHQDFVHTISAWVGSATATSTLFFFAIVFLMLLALQFSVRLSKLTHRHKTMGQRLALLEEEVERLRGAPLPLDAPVPLRETTRSRTESRPDARDGVA